MKESFESVNRLKVSENLEKNGSNDDLIKRRGHKWLCHFVAITPKVLHTDFHKKWAGYGICIKNSSKVKEQYLC